MRPALVSLALLLGACSTGSSGDPPAASEVSFDPAATGLTATTVQAALAELDQAVASGTAAAAAANAAQDGRLAALEGGAVAAAGVSYDATASGLAGGTVQAALDEVASEVGTLIASRQSVLSEQTVLAGKLAALEGKTIGAESVPLAPIEGLKATSVQAAFNELLALIKSQSTVIEELKAKVDAPIKCPDGLMDIGGGCIEPLPRDDLQWHEASGTCEFAGLRLCSYAEYSIACAKGVLTDAAPEWTGTWTGDKTVLLAAFPANGWNSYSGVPASLDSDPFHPFRCCKSR